MGKPILCLDFDGVIHSYTSGWKGARVISDTPVPGALEFILGAMNEFDIFIFSSRSNYWFGRFAMKRWLTKCLFDLLMQDNDLTQRIDVSNTMEPWYILAKEHAQEIVAQIKWPKHKAPAMVTIDDRAITFTGEWPSIPELLAFKPWNKKEKAK